MPDKTASRLPSIHRLSAARARALTPLALAAAGALALGACGTTTPGTTTTTAGGPGSTATPPTAGASPVTLTEAGSSLLFPLFQKWAPAYHTQVPNVTISPAAGGSGKGISDAIASTVNIGASDAYLPPAEVSKHPGLENIPLAISAQQINYNLPGVTKHLKLSGAILSGIYQGKITTWNDPAITAANPGVKVPATKIVPLHRSDGSGDSFIFTQFLSKADPSGWGAKYGFNTAYPGPAISGALAENGNGGMVTGCAATPGCIAYIGISYLAKTNAAGLGEAMLENASHNYLLPTNSTISAEAAGYASKTPANESISLIYGPAAQGYPIINYEYAIVTTSQPKPATGAALKAFLSWASNPADGSAPSFLSQVGFQPLPASVVALSATQINKIS
ncbi:MAG: phosphate ABC transporter substrate-binding protein PstS [Acidimicrobiales bacterium]